MRWANRIVKMQAEEDTLENVVYDVELEIKNSDGLHMRPAMKFVDIANRFESEINVSNADKHARRHMRNEIESHGQGAGCPTGN
jgi:hypothetical protein